MARRKPRRNPHRAHKNAMSRRRFRSLSPPSAADREAAGRAVERRLAARAAIREQMQQRGGYHSEAQLLQMLPAMIAQAKTIKKATEKFSKDRQWMSDRFIANSTSAQIDEMDTFLRAASRREWGPADLKVIQDFARWRMPKGDTARKNTGYVAAKIRANTARRNGEKKALAMARKYLGKRVKLRFDQPVGSSYAPHGIDSYPINYGYVPGTLAPDGDELDAYLLNVHVPLQEAEGVCIAIIHRRDDDDDKLIVVPELVHMTDKEIMDQVRFQEHLYDGIVVRR